MLIKFDQCRSHKFNPTKQQETSIRAYERVAQNLGKKQKEVLDGLRFFPDATNAELAARLG
jgi:hypothetical protein